MYIGAATIAICIALAIYTHRLLGIKVSVLVRTKERLKSALVLLLIFAVILIFGRQFRVYEGFEYAPHIAALIAGSLVGYLLYKYPTGEFFKEKKYND
jgi:membrane associated rhomboid family serine protease